MDDPDYTPLVIEHFEHPRNHGTLPEGPEVVVGMAGSVEQGTAFKLSAQVIGDRLAAVRFEAYGCPHSIAAGSWSAERLRGATRADLQRWSWREPAAALDVPAHKRGRLLILEDAVRALGEDWEARDIE